MWRRFSQHPRVIGQSPNKGLEISKFDKKIEFMFSEFFSKGKKILEVVFEGKISNPCEFCDSF